MTNLNNNGKKPGYVRLVHPHTGEQLYMPNMLFMKNKALKPFMRVIKEIQKNDNDKLKEGNEVHEFDNMELFIEAAEILQEHYPEYDEFSKDFVFQEHMKVIYSINGNINQKEITDNLKDNSMVHPDDVMDRDNPGEDNEGFLSAPQST